jgi:hypothetical protein
MVITADEYRKILNDATSTDEQIAKRVEYLEAFCRNIIKVELETLIESTRQTRRSKKKNENEQGKEV